MNCDLCKISIPSQVTTVMLQSTTVYLKSAPAGLCLSHQRNQGETSAVARSCGWVTLWMVKVGDMATVSHDFFTVTPHFGTNASWGFGVNIHHFEQEINLVGEKLQNKRNNQTKIVAKSGLSLCTVTNTHHHCFELFCLMRNYLFFLLFSVKTKHAAYLVYAVSVTLEGEETDETNDASSANCSRRGGHDLKRIHMTTSSTCFSTSPFFPSLLYNHLFHCIRHSRVTEACCSYKAVCSWLKNWPLVPLYVCLVTGG